MSFFFHESLSYLSWDNKAAALLSHHRISYHCQSEPAAFPSLKEHCSKMGQGLP